MQSELNLEQIEKDNDFVVESKAEKIKSESKYYNAPLSVTSQFYFCPMPLRLDTFSGCTNNCLYCFANNSGQKFTNNPENLKIATQHTNDFVKPTKFEYVKKYFDIAFEGAKNTFDNQEACAIEALQRRIPIHFGGMSDPFQPKEKTERITLRVLQLLKKYNYPVVISTKCRLICEPEYYEILKDYDNASIQVSMIDNRQEVLSILEAGLGDNSVNDRWEILETYKHKWTAVRIQPFIIHLTEPIIEQFLEEIKSHNVNHVVVEGLKFMNGNPMANKIISVAFQKMTGKPFNLMHHYKSIGAVVSGNDLELPTHRKYQYVMKIKRKCEDLGLTLGVADNDLRFLGDGPCCCGNSQMAGMENVCKHNIGFAVFKAMKENRSITYDLIKDEWFWKGKFRQVMSLKDLQKKLGPSATTEDANVPLIKLFMEQWNTAGKNSPCQMCNVKTANSLDADKNFVYDFKNDIEFAYAIKPLDQKLLSEYDRNYSGN